MDTESLRKKKKNRECRYGTKIENSKLKQNVFRHKFIIIQAFQTNRISKTYWSCARSNKILSEFTSIIQLSFDILPPETWHERNISLPSRYGPAGWLILNSLPSELKIFGCDGWTTIKKKYIVSETVSGSFLFYFNAVRRITSVIIQLWKAVLCGDSLLDTEFIFIDVSSNDLRFVLFKCFLFANELKCILNLFNFTKIWNKNLLGWI